MEPDENTWQERLYNDKFVTNKLDAVHNTTIVTGTNTAYGVCTYNNSNNLLGTFAGNNMTIKFLVNEVYGFLLDVDNGDFGTASSPIVIKDNAIKLIADAATSAAVFFYTDTGNEDVYTKILENSISFTNTGTGDILGIWFEDGTLGNIGFYPNNPVVISDNSFRFYGGSNQLIHINTGNANNFNYLNWGGNSLLNTGTWTGNYGPNNEVEHNFSGSDMIIP